MRRKRLSIPAAILLASLILSAAVIYGARLIAEQVGSGYAPAAPAPAPLRTTVELPAAPEAQSVAPSGITIGPTTPLKVGATVLAPDQGRWWRAEVVALEDGGRVRVHFRGWDPTWDRSVSRDQLQVDVRSRDDGK
jgi:hypothetical protein